MAGWGFTDGVCDVKVRKCMKKIKEGSKLEHIRVWPETEVADS